jgi:hypothetical protein
MNDWRVILVVLLIGVLVWAAIEQRVSSFTGVKRLRRNRRSVSAIQAIAEHESGVASLFHNRSLMPGEWWLLRKQDRHPDCDLLANLEVSGFVVECEAAADRQRLKPYLEKVEEVLEPFA